MNLFRRKRVPDIVSDVHNMMFSIILPLAVSIDYAEIMGNIFATSGIRQNVNAGTPQKVFPKDHTCKNCGANEFTKEQGYDKCTYCGGFDIDKSQ